MLTVFLLALLISPVGCSGMKLGAVWISRESGYTHHLFLVDNASGALWYLGTDASPGPRPWVLERTLRKPEPLIPGEVHPDALGAVVIPFKPGEWPGVALCSDPTTAATFRRLLDRPELRTILNGPVIVTTEVQGRPCCIVRRTPDGFEFAFEDGTDADYNDAVIEVTLEAVVVSVGELKISIKRESPEEYDVLLLDRSTGSVIRITPDGEASPIIGTLDVHPERLGIALKGEDTVLCSDAETAEVLRKLAEESPELRAFLDGAIIAWTTEVVGRRVDACRGSTKCEHGVWYLRFGFEDGWDGVVDYDDVIVEITGPRGNFNPLSVLPLILMPRGRNPWRS
ncbi:hypothetical protein [Methanopyrus kandleri]|uniref:Uncharacterized protein n=2 Tax=Methanopyrus kandleri TaxID=2320 RepID=Q8TWL3_METKA|nr:hypothetical protein [Methanopyrus kandleri]AAM02233.1 Uncharacterized protein MK1020 [Methanopyrus kandleri AV19]HII69650.1 hypothetical protein [Methanopyrus kandleri]